MERKRRRAGLLALLLILNMTAVTACGDTQGPVLVRHDFTENGGDAATVSANLPAPEILVDQEGYDADSRKMAVVESSQPVAEFRLVAEETGEVVYTGTLEEPEYDEVSDRYISIADFTEVVSEGTYYLKCDGDGTSLTFAIRKGQYEEFLNSLCEEVQEQCRKQKITEEEVYQLLVAVEWYAEALPDGAADGCPELLQSVVRWIQETEERTQTLDSESMWYVAILAKASYLYREYDAEYAAKCLRRASTIYAELYPESRSVSDSDLYAWVDGEDPDRFLALTELYRATGYRTYRIQIHQYKDYYLNRADTVFPKNAADLYGAMTYLSTRRSVDMDLCEMFTGQIRDRGEELSKRSGGLPDAAASADSSTEELLWKAEELSCANYILYSYQYTEILEDVLHYLMGRNRNAVCYYTEEGDRCEYLLLIAQLVSLRDKY